MIGCAGTPAPQPIPMPSMPSDWGYNIDLSKTKCQPIVGVIENLGIRQKENGVRTPNGLLSKDVLMRSLPERMIAESIAIYSDTDPGILTAELRGEISRKIEIEVACQSGWHVFTYERSGNYLGDGVQEIKFMHRAWLRSDRDGNIIARVRRNAVYEIQFAEQTTESSEEWFFFQPL